MVAFHGRHRPAEQNEGHRNRWNRRSCSLAPFASCHPADRKGCPIDQGRFLQVGSRHLPRTPTFPMAGKIWVVQRERVAIGHAHSLHPQAGAASSQYNVAGGIPGVAEEAPDRIRRGVSVGLSSAVPAGLASFPRVPGSELPGYYRQSLRDYSPISAPKMSELQRRVAPSSARCWETPGRSTVPTLGRLQGGDTADLKSALQWSARSAVNRYDAGSTLDRR